MTSYVAVSINCLQYLQRMLQTSFVCLVSILIQNILLILLCIVIFSLHIIYDLACSAGVFFGRANVFAREAPILKLPKERKWGESKGAGRGREERTENLLLPSPFPSVALAPTLRDTNMNKVSPTQNTPALQAIYDWINITGYNKNHAYSGVC